VVITVHAVERYRQRGNPALTPAEASAAIMSAERAIEAAARINCHVVRMGNGAKLMVREGRVITVLFPCLPWSGHRFGGVS